MNFFSFSFKQHVRRIADRLMFTHQTADAKRHILFGVPIFLFLIVSGALSGCGAEHVNSSDIIDNPTSAIIVVPGYYGTRLLRSSDEHLIWISASEALFGNQPLTLPVPGLELTNAIDLRPDLILDQVPVVPYIYEVDVYGPLIDILRSETDRDMEVIAFSYDWRKDLMDSVIRLDAMIQQLQAKGTHDIALVAHSLGGLIVSYYLRYGTQEMGTAVETWEGTGNITRVIMAGVPFLGVMNSLRNMNFGVTVKFNTSMLTAEAYSSFPSSYYTLPFLDTDQLLSPTLEPLTQMIRNPENWMQSGWGLLSKPQNMSAEIMRRRADYTSFWLRRSQQFLGLLRAPGQSSTPNRLPLLYLYAKGRPTLANGVWMKKNGRGPNSLYFDNGNPEKLPRAIDSAIFYEDGDETVTVRSALLPAAYQESFSTTVREYDVRHTEFVTDTQTLQDMVSFLNNP